MTEPLLHFGDIRLVRECVRGGGGAERMHAQSVNLGVDASGQALMPHDVPVDRCWVKRPVQLFRRAIVFDRAEERPERIDAAASGGGQIFFDQSLRRGVDRHEANLVALAFDAKMHDALTTLDVLHP